MDGFYYHNAQRSVYSVYSVEKGKHVKRRNNPSKTLKDTETRDFYEGMAVKNIH